MGSKNTTPNAIGPKSGNNNKSNATQISSNPKNMIFISYNHASKIIVEKIVQRLRHGNNEVWFDENEIQVGDELAKKMQQGILNSTFVFCFISKKYLKSRNCRLEFFYAQNQNKKCIYFVLEKLEPTDINGIELYLNGDALRFDIYKLLKGATIDREFIENVYKKLAPIINIPEENKVVDESDEILKMKKDDDFIGRDDIFNQIDTKLSTERKTILLYGLPGVGKTSCAKEYIFKKQDSFEKYFIFNCDENYKIKE